MPLVLNGATSGATTLQATDATTQTITLPANSGTIITTASSGKVIPTAALPAGTVLQVVQNKVTSGVSTTSTSYVSTGLTASITPTSATSKIYIWATVPYYQTQSSSPNYVVGFTIFRGTTGGTDLSGGNTWGLGLISIAGNSSQYQMWSNAINDSPATTSSTTYTVAFKVENAACTAASMQAGPSGVITLMEVAA